MIGIMLTVDKVLWTKCSCPMHRPFQKTALLGFKYGMSVQRLNRMLLGEDGQDVAEYAVLLAVIIALTFGLMRLIGASSSQVFSEIGSKIQ